ncbi:MAG: NAD-dependent epimerase/dehydratase family protein [Deltaproteobacteria bacterium]|nr:NAD-dependent epimerase/dehydratase family protein [Deltaproteobacteria bacterium]
MKILVLGGNGFIGSHLVERLLREGHDMRVFDRNPERYRKPLAGVKYDLQDFGNRAALASALENVDMVFHLISTTTPKTSNDDPEFDVTSNLVETVSLLKLCVEKRVRKLIYLSSGGAVYGIPSCLPVHEDDPKNPQSSYGIMKLTVEKYIELFNRLYGLDYAIIRPSNPYGERQNPFADQGVIAVFLGQIARRKPIDIWGDGNAAKDYIYIEDLVDGICRAAFRNTENRIFNLGSGAATSINSIVATIKELTNAPLCVNYNGVKQFDVPNIYLEISRARNELNWNPKTSLKEGVSRAWKFVKGLEEQRDF